MSFSAWFIPLLITGLFSWGLCSGVDVFDCFLQGAKEGLKTAASITPALVCLLTVVTMFCSLPSPSYRGNHRFPSAG